MSAEVSPQFKRIINELVPYINQIYDCSKEEAELITKVAFAAITQKLIVEASVSLPIGKLAMAISPNFNKPLRFKLYPNGRAISRINGEESKRTYIDEVIHPEQLIKLKELQIEAKRIQKDFRKNKAELNGKIQEDSS